ncbi:hypothetical protein OQA88_2259 [Cercophora sp. LCS_1]
MSQPPPRSLSESANAQEELDQAPEANLDDTFGRLACPFLQRFPDEQMPKTCSNGSRDIRHVKEHLKKHHKCGCSRSGRAAACRNRLHIATDQLNIIYKGRRRPGETSGNQWVRIFEQLFPYAAPIPAAYLMPTTEHLVAVARTPPPGFSEFFAEKLSGLLVADSSGGNAALFFRQFQVFLDAVKSWGSNPGPPLLRAPQTAGHDIVGASVAGTQQPVAQITGEELESELEISIEPHEKVSEWIESSKW